MLADIPLPAQTAEKRAEQCPLTNHERVQKSGIKARTAYQALSTRNLSFVLQKEPVEVIGGSECTLP
jgi:hypothetical protein